MQVRDPLDAQRLAELVTDERHRVLERGDRGIALGRLADDADPDLGVAQVRRRLDRRDRGEPDPRIRDVTSDDRADLLPKELVDPLCSLAHRSAQLADAPATTVWDVKHSMMSPSTMSWKFARPMPHS